MAWKMNKVMRELRLNIKSKNLNVMRMFKVMGIRFEEDLEER